MHGPETRETRVLWRLRIAQKHEKTQALWRLCMAQNHEKTRVLRRLRMAWKHEKTRELCRTENNHRRGWSWGVPPLGLGSTNIIIGGGSAVRGYPRRARGRAKIRRPGGHLRREMCGWTFTQRGLRVRRRRSPHTPPGWTFTERDVRAHRRRPLHTPPGWTFTERDVRALPLFLLLLNP